MQLQKKAWNHTYVMYEQQWQNYIGMVKQAV